MQRFGPNAGWRKDAGMSAVRAEEKSPAERPYVFDARNADEHVLDHGALWEALLYLNRKVIWLEDQMDGGDE